MFGLLALLSMLQVNLRVAYAACAAADSSQAAEAANAGEVDHHAHHSPSETPQDTSLPSDEGSPVGCCQAMTSCGTVIGPGRVVQTALSELDETVVIPAAVTIPLSCIAAPEPPPPKA